MRLFVVAWREAHVPSSLAAAGRRIDLDVQVMTPPEAAKAATTDDLVLGYLDVRPTLDGIEPGIAKLRGLGSRGVTVINGPDALRACHDKLVTALRLGRASLPHPETAYLSAASGRRDVSRLRFPLVVKPRFGSRGEHVAAYADPDELGMMIPQPDGSLAVLEVNGAPEFTAAYSLDGRDVFETVLIGLLLPEPAEARPRAVRVS